MRGRSLAAAALVAAVGFAPVLPAQAAEARADALTGPPAGARADPPAGARANTPTAARADTPAGIPAGVSAAALRLARQPLPANDGWAAAGTGTTGGSAADAAHVFVVRNRAELVAALSGEAAPRIVLVDGRFSMSVDADNQPLGCTDYADPAYDLDAFLQAYDPAVWGRAAKPTGPLEDARVRSAKRQGDQIKINVPSDTTIIGINGARIEHGSMILANVRNVIVRNIEFTDSADCFP